MPSRAGNAKRLSQDMESSLSFSSALLHGYCARLPEQSPHNANYANIKIEDFPTETILCTCFLRPNCRVASQLSLERVAGLEKLSRWNLQAPAQRLRLLVGTKRNSPRQPRKR